MGRRLRANLGGRLGSDDNRTSLVRNARQSQPQQDDRNERAEHRSRPLTQRVHQECFPAHLRAIICVFIGTREWELQGWSERRSRPGCAIVVVMAIKKILAGAALMTLAASCAGTPGGVVELHEQVSLLRLPEGGRLPRAVIDDRGAVHAIYFEGDPRAGDLRYITRAPDETTWSEPRYVNSQRGTVVGIGPIDGGQLALGRDGRLHVVWFKLGRTEFLYTRTVDAPAADGGVRFEPQFALAGGEGVEAGPSVAADPSGNVYIFWHTGEPPDAERAVYMTASRDEGRTFSVPLTVGPAAEGACDCCGLHALVGTSGSSKGSVYVSYRGAGDNIRRSQRLLTSTDAGATFTDQELDPWEINACPISTTTLANGPDGVAVAWETEGRVYFRKADTGNKTWSPADGTLARQKNPAVAVNARGETLLAWGDGPGWQSGGTFHWQLFGDGTTQQDRGTGPEIPEGSVAAVVAETDGRFLVIY